MGYRRVFLIRRWEFVGLSGGITVGCTLGGALLVGMYVGCTLGGELYIGACAVGGIFVVHTLTLGGAGVIMVVALFPGLVAA